MEPDAEQYPEDNVAELTAVFERAKAALIEAQPEFHTHSATHNTNHEGWIHLLVLVVVVGLVYLMVYLTDLIPQPSMSLYSQAPNLPKQSTVRAVADARLKPVTTTTVPSCPPSVTVDPPNETPSWCMLTPDQILSWQTQVRAQQAQQAQQRQMMLMAPLVFGQVQQQEQAFAAQEAASAAAQAAQRAANVGVPPLP